MRSLCCAPWACPLTCLCSLGHGYLETACCLPIPGCRFWSCTAPCLACTCCEQKGNNALLLGDGSKGKRPIAVVTGGNRGLGLHTARALLQQGHEVMLLCRNPELGAAAVNQLKRFGHVELFVVDLGDLASVEAFCQTVATRKLAITSLVNNAGIISKRAMAVNHLGHFALTIGLLPALLAAPGPAVVVNVASCVHWSATLRELDSPVVQQMQDCSDDWGSYSTSKSANVVFTHSLARKLAGTNVRVTSYHPGVMPTDLWRDNGSGDLLKKCRPLVSIAGAVCCCITKPACVSATSLAFLSSPKVCFSYSPSCVQGASGRYYQQCCCCMLAPVRESPVTFDEGMQERLWNASVTVVSASVGAETAFTRGLARLQSPQSDAGILSRGGSGQLCGAAWPCSECLSVAPNCGLGAAFL